MAAPAGFQPASGSSPALRFRGGGIGLLMLRCQILHFVTGESLVGGNRLRVSIGLVPFQPPLVALEELMTAVATARLTVSLFHFGFR